MTDITIDQKGCARCDGDGHDGIVFQEFVRPIVLPMPDGELVITHWSMCPTVNEPILLIITPGPLPVEEQT